MERHRHRTSEVSPLHQSGGGADGLQLRQARQLLQDIGRAIQGIFDANASGDREISQADAGLDQTNAVRPTQQTRTEVRPQLSQDRNSADQGLER